MGSSDKTDWSWQIEQWQRRTGEWLELNIFPSADRAIRSANWTIDDWVFQAAIWLAWIILGGTIAWLLWQLSKVLRPYLAMIGWLTPRLGTTETAEIAPAAIEWEQRSQTFAQRGEYSEACRALYMAMLQRLHEATLAPQQPSRTDGEYLQLLRMIPRWQTYQVIVSTHERLCFNNEMFSLNTFELCQRAYQDLMQYLSALQKS